MAKSAIVRMYKKVRLGLNGCHEFYGSKTSDGYGRLSSNNGVVLAHRLSYESIHGKIPDGLCVCHECDNPKCINPCHLYLGTHAENMRDKAIKKRVKSTKGQNNPNSLLSDNQVFEIKRKLSEGCTVKELSKKYNVSYNSILKIKNEKTWIHVKY